MIGIYSDDSLIRTRLFPADISGLKSFPDYWIAHKSETEIGSLTFCPD